MTTATRAQRLITTAPGDQVAADPNGQHASAWIGRTERRPNSVFLGRFRPWRWQVTTFELIEGEHPGVYDKWFHVGGDCGFTATRFGARLAVGRRVPHGGRSRF